MLSEVAFFSGVEAMEAGNWPLAEAHFVEAIGLAPDFAEALADLAYVLEQEGRAVEAEGYYRRSLAANPSIAQTYLNLGSLLLAQKRLDDAEAAFRRAIVLAPDLPAAWSNLGVLLASCKREEEAEASYRTALGLDPDYRLAAFNCSYLLLRQGRYAEGWQCLEARCWYERLEKWVPFPRWRGESLAGKQLLIGFEAGLGDMIQFARYVPVVKSRGAAKVAIVCHPPLKSLFASLDGIDAVFDFNEPFVADDWDFWSPPLSLPFHCQTRLATIPATLPYLHAEPARVAKWASRLATGGLGYRVGLVWQGNPRFENDADRSLPGLATLAPLGDVAGVRLISVQKGAGEEETAAPPPGLRIESFASEINDFADTAALVANLDLVISVDTSVAHLTGALGKACWILLPDYKTDWRWLAERDDSPWYPQVVRLFRQRASGGWEPVVDAVREALRDRLGHSHVQPR